MLNMEKDYKKYRQGKVFKGIWLSTHESESWDVEFIRSMLNGKGKVLNSNNEYVKQLETIIKDLIIGGVNDEQQRTIKDIITATR